MKSRKIEGKTDSKRGKKIEVEGKEKRKKVRWWKEWKGNEEGNDM